jgi:hypothetical protein
VSFEAIEQGGVDGFIEQIWDELATRRYRPMRNRRKEIPQDGGKKVRVLSIPSIRDRVVQGALKLILEPILEADFQPGSFGYRPNRTAHEAVLRIDRATGYGKTRVIDVDLRAYFNNVRHHILLAKVAKRVNDPDVMHLLKLILKATGEKGVPQGGVVSPLLSNIYLNDVAGCWRGRRRSRAAASTHSSSTHASPTISRSWRTTIAGGASGGLQASPIPAGGNGHPDCQPGSPRLGELLSYRALGPVLRLRPRLGRAKSAAASDAQLEAQRLRLEEVE